MKVYGHILSRYFFIIYLLFTSICGSAQEVLDTDTLVPVAQEKRVDTASNFTTKLTQLKQRFGKYDTRFLENINVTSLAKELQTLAQQHVQAIRLKDSLHAEDLADTLDFLRKSTKERISRLRSFKTTVANYQTSLEVVSDSLKQLAVDTLFHLETSQQPTSIDVNALSNLHTEIRQKEIQTTQKLDSLHLLVRDATQLLLNNESLLTDLSASQDEVQVVKARKNARNIWSAPATFDKKNLVGSLKASYQESKDISEYVKQTEWTGRIFLVLLSIAFFYWLYTRGKQAHQSTERRTNYRYTSDILKALVFLLTLLPIFSVFTPTLLVQLTQLLVVILLVIDFHKLMSKAQQRALFYLLLFYVLTILTNTLVDADLILRLFTLFLNLAALYICYRMLKGSSSRYTKFKINRYAFMALVLIHVIAILCNIFGYVEYARYWSIGGAVAILQSISLVGFYHIVVEAFERQFRYVSIRGASSRFDKGRTMQSIKKLLTLICALLSIIVLVINLHSVQQFFNWLFAVLDKPRHMGNITFTFGNVLVGIVIIAISNWLQKHLAILLGDTADKGYTQAAERSNILSLMPIFRLLIIVAGFLIGVSALGIGLDKLTVIISALSVGIGFGLQNVINNFISGIILIFEKPFRTGDFIELADKKGRVQEIGIRSSTLLTQEGSEVIIPNGDLLSGRLVNWTLSKSYSRTSVSIKVAKDTDMDVIKRVLHDVTGKIDYLMENSEIEMLYNGVEDNAIRLKLNAWIVHIYNEEIFRSQLIAHLNQALAAEGITMVSV
ncbi:hypothetical protein GCM10023231_21120 [Olivibacter ginsenosidimutans]|uniref:Mechanosensitive ion channel MscS domain-containing protein n=1 Tax=Olivibacter ginsenosidimutans TaxID=1176537 RepID=A0ABP9BAY5_9SPHI